MIPASIVSSGSPTTQWHDEGLEGEDEEEQNKRRTSPRCVGAQGAFHSLDFSRNVTFLGVEGLCVRC